MFSQSASRVAFSVNMFTGSIKGLAREGPPISPSISQFIKMVSLSSPGPMMDEIEKTNKSSPPVDKHPFNWWYKDEKKMPDKTIEPPKLKIPNPRSESADVTPIMESQERRGSVTLVDMQPPQMNQQRRDSDIDRLYRLSNLIHACGSRDD